MAHQITKTSPPPQKDSNLIEQDHIKLEESQGFATMMECVNEAEECKEQSNQNSTNNQNQLLLKSSMVNDTAKKQKIEECNQLIADFNSISQSSKASSKSTLIIPIEFIEDIIVCIQNLQLMIEKLYDSLIITSDTLEFQSMLEKSILLGVEVLNQFSEVSQQAHKNEDQFNYLAYLEGIYILNTYFCEVSHICDSTSAEDSFKYDYETASNELLIMNAKINLLLEMLSNAAKFSKIDIFSKPQTPEISSEWELLNKNIDAIQIAQSEKIAKATHEIIKKVLLGNAMAARGAEEDNQKNILSPAAIYYICRPEVTQRKAQIFFASPNERTVIQVLNFVDKVYHYSAVKLLLPSIQYKNKIYIERGGISFTRDSVLEGLQNNTLNTITPVDSSSYPMNNIDSTQDSYYYSLFEKNQLNRISVRVLAPEQLKRPVNGKASKWFNSVIVHLHGGGFVAMSTCSHQMYSRKWMKQVKAPLFSIDYGKAPKHPYPEGLDDCFQVYQWILKHIHNIFNIKPERVVFVGDSSGGNFVVALTQLCIKYGVKPPCGIVPIYPSLNLNFNQFTPSILLSLEDQLLPPMFLKILLGAYIDSTAPFDASKDPFLSPVVVSDEILEHFPPTRIVIGTIDSFKDDCYRFIHKLLKKNIDGRLTLLNDMVHGFLCFDAPSGLKYAATCVKICGDLISKLLKPEQKRKSSIFGLLNK